MTSRHCQFPYSKLICLNQFFRLDITFALYNHTNQNLTEYIILLNTLNIYLVNDTKLLTVFQLFVNLIQYIFQFLILFFVEKI